MATPDVYLKAIAAIVCTSFALVLASAAGSRSSVRLLAAFTGLIAVNQGAEAMRALAVDATAQTFWYKLASAAASIDPLLLYAACASFARGPRWTRAPALAAVALPGFALALYSGWALSETTIVVPIGFTVALSAYTALVYGAALLGMLDSAIARSERTDLVALVPALAVVALTAVDRAGVDALVRLEFISSSIRHGSFLVSFAFGAFLVLRARKRSAPAVARVTSLGVGLGVVVLLIVKPGDVLQVIGLGELMGPTTEYMGRAGAAVRWLLFGALASRAIFGSDTLGIGVGARRRAARVLVGLSALVLVAAALLVAQAATGRAGLLAPLDLGIVVLALALSQYFRSVVDRVSQSLYGVPPAGDLAAAQHAYRRAAEDSLARGHVPSRDPALQRLREDLAMDAGMASVLERLAEESSGLALAPGRVVGNRYRVQWLLGGGGGGRAYAAEDLLLKRSVVLKEVPLAATGGGEHAGLREARMAGALAHANVVALHDVLTRTGAAILVMEYAPGGNLAERVSARGPFDPREGAKLFAGVLAGVEAVHARGILHGDLKPANVVLGNDGAPKLSDFGVSRLEHTATVDAGAVELLGGTPAFMSPERLRGARPTVQSDLFSVGAMMQACIASPLPPALEAIARRALAAEPSARWSSASEMREALLAYVQ